MFVEDTLEQAMRHENNVIPDILNDLAPTPETLRLSRDRGGLICDPRPGHTERNASFSVGIKSGISVWHRFGGDNASGNVFSLLIALGFSKRQAAEYLIQRAGLSNTVSFTRGPRVEIHEPTATERAESATSKFNPLTTRGLERVNALTRPVRATEHAALEISKRGLAIAQVAFRVLKNDYVTHGRTIALAGGLVFFVTNGKGEVWAVKVRNPGTEEQLKARGIARFGYLVAGHGSPPWCSLDDGSSDTVAIVEGEMNAMALSLILGSRFAVQGVAGAGAVPYLGSLENRHVLLYADDDQAGADALNRWGLLALENGARSVKVLESLPYPNDYCDVHATLGEWLPVAIENAKTFAPTLAPPKKDPLKNAVQYTNRLHHTKHPLSGGAMVQAYNPLAKFQRKLDRLTRGLR
jgi:hypothetical protein